MSSNKVIDFKNVFMFLYHSMAANDMHRAAAGNLGCLHIDLPTTDGVDRNRSTSL